MRGPTHPMNMGPGPIPTHMPYYYQIGQHGNVFYPPIVPQYNTVYSPHQQHIQMPPIQYQANAYLQQPPPNPVQSYDFSQQSAVMPNFVNNKRKFGDINSYISNSNSMANNTNINSRFQNENSYSTNKSINKLNKGKYRFKNPFPMGSILYLDIGSIIYL